MAFTVRDFDDLKQLLVAHPEWRVELRDLLLSEDFLALAAIVRELVEAQRHTEQRVAELVDAQRHTEQRLAELAERVVELVEAQRRTDQRLAELAEAQQRLEIRLGRVEDKLGGLQGRELENRYRQRAGAFFGRWFRSIQVVEDNDLIDRVESHLSPEQLHDVLLTDLIVRGRAVQRPERPEVWLAIEISSVVDRADVERAVRRAELLRRVGLPAVPVVAGENATAGAKAEAKVAGAALFQDGFAQFWEEAFAAWPV